MTYAIELRLRLIDFLLESYGCVAPRQLVDFFGISRPQASIDFALYNETFPGNMVYMHSTLTWQATEEFKRAYP